VLRDTRVQRRDITTGVEVDGGKALEIRSGLAAGEEVVIAGADGLGDDTTVRVVRDVNPYTGVAGATATAPKPDAAGAPPARPR
jgi:hypothetical protein